MQTPEKLLKSLRIVTLFVFSILLPLSTRGAAKFWDGSANGNWSNGANWVGGIAPVAGDDLVFQINSLVTRFTVTNDFSPNRAFTSILFQGSNYVVRGNSLLITNGITSINSVGPNTIDADVDVRASQPWEAQGPLAVLDFNGDINLNGNTLTVRANTGDFFFSGIVTGTGNLVKTNVGTLRMDGGAGHNTYSGFTHFDGGVLELDKFAIFPSFTNFTSIPGDLTVGDGNNLVGTDVLRLLSDDQIADTSDVTVKNSGRMDLNGNSDRIASLTMQGGMITNSGSGALILGGNVTGLDDTHTAVIEGTLSLGGATRTFDISAGGASPDMRVSANILPGTSIFASAGVIKNGGGTLEFRGTNSYNGTTFVNDSQLAITSDRALGTTTTPLGSTAGTIINGDANLFLSNVQVTNEALTINAVNSSGDFNCSGASVWTGTILLNTNTFLGGSGTLLLNGAISGVGGFTKIGAGSVTLAGTNANTYTGTTTVKDGTLLLDKDTSVVLDGAMSGPLIVGEDELPENTDVVRWLACCQLPDTTDITINASGLVDLNGFGQNVSDLIFNGGDLDAPSPGSILPIGNITVNRNTNSQAIISGRMSVLSNPIIDVTGHFFSPDLRIDAQLFGAGNLTKNGVGEVSVTTSNTYTGLTTVNDGFLEVDDSFGLGTTNNGTVVNSGAVLALRFNSHVGAEALTLAGTGQSTFGALSSSFGSNSWAGNITLAANATISVDAGDFLNLSGAIGGAHAVTKTDTGTLLYSGSSANTYSGTTTVNTGTLQLNKTIANSAIVGDLTIGDGIGAVNADVVRYVLDNQISDTSAIHISSSGLLDMNDQIDTTGSIDGSSTSSRIDLGSGILRAGNDSLSSTYNGLILGTGALFKLGTGTWTIAGNNTYTGTTTVSAGTLVVNGSQPQSPVAVNGTATLMGNGTIGNLFVFGTLRPGSSPGMLTCSNGAFSNTGDYFAELNGPNAGTDYDQLNIRGTNNVGSATLHVTTAFTTPVAIGQKFTIINNDGGDAITGTFTGLSEGALIMAGNYKFTISYIGGTGNDVVLTLTDVPGTNVSATVTSGNGNHIIDPNECNSLDLVLSNKTASTMSSITAVLSTTTPGVIVSQPYSAYPNIPVNGKRTNSTPFQISTLPSFPCGTNIDLQLSVESSAGPFTATFVLTTAAVCSTNSGACDTCLPPITNSITAGDLSQTNRISRDHILASCGLPKASINQIGGSFHYDVYAFTNTSTADACVTVKLSASCDLQCSAYLGSFDPLNITNNYIGDAGFSTGPGVDGLNGPTTFSCTVPVGAKFLVAVNETTTGAGCGSYTLQLSGLPCPPPTLKIESVPSDQARLFWSTAAGGFLLEAESNLVANVWATITNEPIVSGGNYNVTNTTVSPTNRFYRLRRP